jgi:hypothetical protein
MVEPSLVEDSHIHIQEQIGPLEGEKLLDMNIGSKLFASGNWKSHRTGKSNHLVVDDSWREGTE